MAALGGYGTSTAQEMAPPQCRSAGPLVRVPGLPEMSGLAASRNSPDRLWSLNDSGDPALVALDTRGSVMARVRLSGLEVDDWEAVAVGACPGGSCLYIADIGDNEAKRTRVTIYRVPEPDEGSVLVAETFHAIYPDGPRDAETLLVAPDGHLFIVSKGETGPIGVYRFPRGLRPGGTHQLERVGGPRGGSRSAQRASEDERITDGAVSPDGSWVVLRTGHALAFHRPADLFAGNWVEAARLDLRALGEPQGEGVAIGMDGTVYLAGESGGTSTSGSFARLTCSIGVRATAASADQAWPRSRSFRMSVP